MIPRRSTACRQLSSMWLRYYRTGAASATFFVRTREIERQQFHYGQTHKFAQKSSASCRYLHEIGACSARISSEHLACIHICPTTPQATILLTRSIFRQVNGWRLATIVEPLQICRASTTGLRYKRTADRTEMLTSESSLNSCLHEC